MSIPTILIPDDAGEKLRRGVEYFCSSFNGDEKYHLELCITPTGNNKGYECTGSGDKYLITGDDEDCLLLGLKRFAEHPGNSFGEFTENMRIFDNLVLWELKSRSLIEAPPAEKKSATMKYCSLIELNAQSDPENNGILIATAERYLDGHLCPVYRSTDKGATWTLVTLLEDTFHPGIRTTFAPCVYELPRKVGDMPAGTLILGSNSVGSRWDEGYVVLYRSFDAGLTWECYSVVAGGHAHDGEFGVWEPFFVLTDDDRLICYYSDDFDLTCSQTLVCKESKDGVHWSEQITLLRLVNDRGLRPGMPVVIRLNDGRYMMVYEIVCLPGNPLYYKISDNPSAFGDPSEWGTLIKAGDKSLAATPWAAYDSCHGKDGMLAVTGWRMASGISLTGSDILVSTDKGGHWQAVDNFYAYRWESDRDTWGYSVCTLFSFDGKTLYYMANPAGDDPNTTHFTLFTIKIS